MKKLALLMIFIVIVLPLVSAAVSITKPENKTYSYSVKIPLEFTYTGATSAEASCSYSFDAGHINTSIECDDNSFNVDWDGSYNLTVWVENTTDNTIEKDNVMFGVDRDFTQAKSNVILILLICSFLIPLLFFWLSVNFEFEFFAPWHKISIKALFFFLGFGLLFWFVILAKLAADEYIKISWFLTSFNILHKILIWGLIFIGFYLLFVIILTIIKLIKDYLTSMKF